MAAMADKCLDEKKYSKYFKAFGDPSRLKIISILANREMTVNDIVEQMGLAQPTVSRHLAILREAEVVIDRRQGQNVFYSLNKNTVQTCCTGFCNCLAIPVPRLKNIKKK